LSHASRPRRVLGVLVATGALLALGTTAASSAGAATGSTTTAASSQAQAKFTVVATGLNNPRGLAFDAHGALYVAEAGRGGNGKCITGPEGDQQCFGSSGSVTRIAGGRQSRILRGLPSLAAKDGTRATGPSDVAFGNGRALVQVQNPGGGPETRQQFGAAGAAFGRLLRVFPRPIRSLADFPAFEAAHNPDNGAGAQPGEEIDSDPYAVAIKGAFAVVADAGGNDLLKVDRKGRITVLATFPVRMVPAPPELNLPPGTKIPMQAVPDSVARGPDGAWYVGELTGFPFPKGAARIWRIAPGHKPSIVAGGFTNIIDLAFDHRGRLNVLEIARNGLTSGDPTGALFRIERDGHRTLIASTGLVNPAGLAIARDGSFFVSNFGVFPGTSNGQLPGTGQVIRISRR
jgi:sugar lactone lactonase YvrE